MQKSEKRLLEQYISLIAERQATDHYKIVCDVCGTVISQCRCRDCDKRVMHDTCEECSVNEALSPWSGKRKRTKELKKELAKALNDPTYKSRIFPNLRKYADDVLAGKKVEFPWEYKKVDEIDMPEDEDELDEMNVVANISGFTAPLGMNPSGTSPKKRATWK